MCKNDKFHLSVRVTSTLLKDLDQWALRHNVSRSAAVSILLTQSLASELRNSNSEGSDSDV